MITPIVHGQNARPGHLGFLSMITRIVHGQNAQTGSAGRRVAQVGGSVPDNLLLSPPALPRQDDEARDEGVTDRISRVSCPIAARPGKGGCGVSRLITPDA